MYRQLIAAFTVSMLLSCGRLPTVLDADRTPTPSSSTAAGEPTPSAPPLVPVGVGEGGSLTECEEVGLERRGIRWTLGDGRQLLLFVPMSPVIGGPYVNVWTPDVNTTFLGRGPANEWFSVSLPGFGSWQIRLAAETIDPYGNVRQCDRHAFVVVARPPPPPPPPPPEPEDPCNAAELLEEATIECGSLEVQSVDFEACSFECGS